MSDVARIQYKFMLPEPLKRRLEDAAHEHRRSLSAEIVARLEDSFEVEAALPMFGGTLDSFEDSVRQNREMLEMSKMMLDEVKGLRAVIGHIASNDGPISDELRAILRQLSAAPPKED